MLAGADAKVGVSVTARETARAIAWAKVKTKRICNQSAHLHEGEAEQHKQRQASANSLHVCCVDLPPDVTNHPALFSSWHLRSTFLNGFSWQSGAHKLRSRDICRSSYKSVSKQFCRSSGRLEFMIVVTTCEIAFKLARHDTTCSGQQPILNNHRSSHDAFKIKCEWGMRLALKRFKS